MRGLLWVSFLSFAAVGCANVANVRADNLVGVEVLERASGRTLETYRQGGKTWVAGNPGERYTVRLVNRTAGRVLAVLSVDGVNAISGETASMQQSGYVLDPGASAEIRGWRKSLEEIAQFYFTPLSDSYAARTNRPANVGVIGVAVFTEIQVPQPAPEVWRRSEPAPTVAGRSNAQGAARDAASEAEGASLPGESSVPQAKQRQPFPREQIGTGHGAREHSPTRYTEFRRASDTPAQVIRVYYDSHANLVARGVIPRHPYQGRPDPFPRDMPGPFVPDPRG